LFPCPWPFVNEMLVGAAGVEVSLVGWIPVGDELPEVFEAVAVIVIVPSASAWALMFVKWTMPAPCVPESVCWMVVLPSVSLSVIVSLATDVEGRLTSTLSAPTFPWSM